MYFCLRVWIPDNFPAWGHACVTAAWAFSTSWMILVEIQSTLFFTVLHWSWLRNEAAHRFHLDTLERERVSSLNVQLKGPHYPTFFKSSFPPFACLGQAMEFSPVGSGSACRGSSPGDNSAERLDSRGLSSAWPSMPVCNRCVMLPLWAFQMFSSWCFHILLYKRMQVWAYEKVLWGLHRAFFGRLSATVCSLAPLGVWNRIASQFVCKSLDTIHIITCHMLAGCSIMSSWVPCCYGKMLGKADAGMPLHCATNL